MNAKDMLKLFNQLPPERQAEVVDFDEFVAQRARPPASPSKRRPIAEEPFVGLWAARKDMADSVGWVRQLREKDWRG